MNVLTQMVVPETLDRAFVPAFCRGTRSHGPSHEDERREGPVIPGEGGSLRVRDRQTGS